MKWLKVLVVRDIDNHEDVSRTTVSYCSSKASSRSPYKARGLVVRIANPHR